MLPSVLTNTIEQFIVYVHRNEAHFTYIMYIIPMDLKLTTFTKTLPQMSFHLYLFAIFISLWGSTNDYVDWWSAHGPPAARDSFNVCTTDYKAGWRRPGAPSPTKILATPVSRTQNVLACNSHQYNQIIFTDTPQFRWGNPYFFSKNLYQSVSFIYASMYRENVHAIRVT